MPSTPLAIRDLGSPPPVHRFPHLAIALAASLALSCAKGATRPDAPKDVLHYPAWIAAFGQQLLVVNLDQDLAYDAGAVVAVDGSAASATSGAVLGGVPVPNMAGQLLLVDAAAAGPCAARLDSSSGAYAVPFAMVGGRFEDALFSIPLAAGSTQPFDGWVQRIDLHPFSASVPFGVGYTCSPGPDQTPRAWVAYQSGQNSVGYVAQVDLTKPPNAAGSVVQVLVGNGPPRSFAYDRDRDRLYFTSREQDLSAPVRWIQVGNGCQSFDGGIQDERQGGCHVDGGFDLSLQFRGAEPNAIQLASGDAAGTPFQCTAAGFVGQPCPRAYLSVRMYDADLAAFLGARPSTDLGGKLMVLELPEGGLGRPEPQVVAQVDIGMIAGDVHLIPRTGKRPLVAVTAVDDDQLWIYDDQVGAVVKVFGRNANGVPPLGHEPVGLASMDVGDPSGLGATERVFVTSYKDDWVSAVDVPLDAPGEAYVVRVQKNGTQNDPTQPVQRWGVTR